MRELHAKCVRIPRKLHSGDTWTSHFLAKIALALALLGIMLKRVDSTDEFSRVRRLFAETIIKLENAYEKI